MPALAWHKQKPRQPRRRVLTVSIVLAAATVAAAVVGWRIWQPGGVQSA